MKWKLLSLILVAASIVALISLRGPSSAKARLPDGSVLELSSVEIATNSVFWCGPVLSRIFRRLIPPKGIQLAGLKLMPPSPIGFDTKTESLAVLFRVLGKATRPYICQYRLLVHGDNDVQFPLDWVGETPDGKWRLLMTQLFPRDSRLLHFRLEAKEVPNQGDWRELMTFVSKNPHVAVVEHWVPDQSNIIHLAPGIDAELGELSIRDEPTHWPERTVWSGLARRDFAQLWDYQAWLPVRFMNDGHATTNWGILGGSVCDSSGNKDFFSPLTVEKVLTNDWMLFRVSRPLDPRKTWKFRVDCLRVPDFRDTNVFSFSLPGPLDGPIYTNYAGYPFKIEYSSEPTLQVSLLGQPANMSPTNHLTLIEAVGDGGEKLRIIGRGGGSKYFAISLAPSSEPVPVHVKVAVEEIYPATFTLQPRDDRSSRRGGSSATPSKP